MSDLIEGMAKVIDHVDWSFPEEASEYRRVARGRAKAVLAFLADPNNISPEMVEAARETVHENQLINVHRDTVFKALTAALKAAMEE